MTPRRARVPSPTLVSRVVEEIGSQISNGSLPPGTKLPSVRQLARDRKLSAFSAAEIYNALVATGDIEARAGAGYFVPHRARGPVAVALQPEFPADSIWERRREANRGRIRVD